MIGYQQPAWNQKTRPQNFDPLPKSKLLKTVNIDLDAMIKESDKEYRATENSQPNDPFDESVTMTMDENLPEPASEMPSMPSEYVNIRMSIPSAQGIIQDSYDTKFNKSNIVQHTDMSNSKQSEYQKNSFSRPNKGSIDLL